MLKDPTPAPLPRKGGERLRMDFSQSCRLFLYLVIFPVLPVVLPVLPVIAAGVCLTAVRRTVADRCCERLPLSRCADGNVRPRRGRGEQHHEQGY